MFVNCSSGSANAKWTYNASSKLLYSSDPQSKAAKCLSAHPPAPVGGFYGGPNPALTSIGSCPKNAPSSSQFTFTADGEIRAGTGVCLMARRLFGPQLWSKPLPKGRVAVLVVNLALQTQEFALPLADVPALKCTGQCSVRDVRAQKDIQPQAKEVHMKLREHESGFFILGPSA